MKPLSKNRKATVMLTHWMSTGPDRSSYLSRLLMGEFVNKFPPEKTYLQNAGLRRGGTP